MSIKDIRSPWLIGFIFLALGFKSYGQKAVTQIDFYRLDPDESEEKMTRIDTFSYMVQIIPVLKQKPDANNINALERHVVFEDRVEEDIIRVEYRTAKSDFSKREIDYEKQTIDGVVAYGHDGFDANKLSYIMQSHISSLSITINNKRVIVDPGLYRNYFTAGITKVMRALNSGLIIIQISGGDGAGHYEVFLVFNSQRLIGKYINNGDMYFKSLVDGFSGTKKFSYEILCHFDEWAYFPGHDLTSFKEKSYFKSESSALMFAGSFDFASLLASDTVYGDYGQVMSPDRNGLLQFFISNAIKSKTDSLQYDVHGIMKDGDEIFSFVGKQSIKLAKFENGERGALVVHGPFVLNVDRNDKNPGKISGLWTYHIKGLKSVPRINPDELLSVSIEDLFKTYSGVMTGAESADIELVKWGNATVAGNWYGTPQNLGWWNGHVSGLREKGDWLRQFDFDGDGVKDDVLFKYSGGAHCCYTIELVLSSDKKTVKYPFEMDGGYVGGVDNSKPEQFKIEDIDHDGLPEIVMQIQTYNGELHPIPLEWRKRYGIRTNNIVIEYDNGRLNVRDLVK